MNDIFHDRFQCFAQRLEYDFTTRTGLLVMNEHDCADMSGCIKVFEGIDPEVKIIRTTQASFRASRHHLPKGRERLGVTDPADLRPSRQLRLLACAWSKLRSRRDADGGGT
jgi:hypothetical protein